MVDDTPPEAASAEHTCPWCSATYTGDPETCPSCGAALTVDPATDTALPGLTAIDAAAIVRAKTPVARPRNRILSWISGEYPDEVPTATEATALAPPDVEVRREMLRLELEAEVANLQAEADSLMAEAAVEGRLPADAPPAEVASAEAPSAEVIEAATEAEAHEGEGPAATA
jgi:hypothetical protein